MTTAHEVGFVHPFTGLIWGGTGAGKTQWLKKFILNCDQLVKPKVQEIWLCYSVLQPAYAEIIKLPNVKLIEGLPSLTEIQETAHIPKLICVDDLLQESEGGGKKDSEITKLFTRGSHHCNASVLFLTQSLFFSANFRIIRLNSHVIVLMRNPADQSQVHALARQLRPGGSRFILDSYADATREKFGYLLMDLAPQTEEVLRYRTKIFPGEISEVYVPRSERI